MEINYDGYPGNTVGGAKRWIENAIQPGGFLSAVIENDLREAVGRADDKNIHLLPEIIRWWYNNAPAASWGSFDRCRKWKLLKTAPTNFPDTWDCAHCGNAILPDEEGGEDIMGNPVCGDCIDKTRDQAEAQGEGSR